MSDTVTVTVIPPCNIHFEKSGETIPAEYDGKTIWGPWAYMCGPCWKNYGIGRLGTGFGQRLIQQGEAS